MTKKNVPVNKYLLTSLILRSSWAKIRYFAVRCVYTNSYLGFDGPILVCRRELDSNKTSEYIRWDGLMESWSFLRTLYLTLILNICKITTNDFIRSIKSSQIIESIIVENLYTMPFGHTISFDKVDYTNFMYKLCIRRFFSIIIF